MDHRHVSLATVSGECGTQLLPTSVPKERETCSTAVIGVSSVSLLVIVTLITVILTQCLLVLRMKRLRVAMQRDNIPLTFNEAYVPHNIMRPRDNGGFMY